MCDDEDSKYLSDIIFRRSLKDKLRFEGVVASIFLGIVGFTAPSGTRGLSIRAAVFGLVIIAFLRWLTYTGRFSNEELFIEQTVRPVELFAIVALVHIFVLIAGQAAMFLTLPDVYLTAAVAIVGTLVFVVFVDSVFKTYRLGWGTLYYRRYREVVEYTGKLDSGPEVLRAVQSVRDLFGLMAMAILGRIWMEVAYHLLKDAIPKRDRDEYIDELAEFVRKVRSERPEEKDKQNIIAVFLISAAIVLPVFAGIIATLSLAVSTFGMLVLVFLVMRLAKHIVGYSYIAFGTLRFDQFITTNKRSISLLAGYTLIVYLLFFYPA